MKLIINKKIIGLLFLVITAVDYALSCEIGGKNTLDCDNLSSVLWDNNVYIGDGNYTIKTIAEILESTTSKVVTNITKDNITNYYYDLKQIPNVFDKKGDTNESISTESILNNDLGEINCCYDKGTNNKKKRTKIKTYKLEGLPTPKKINIDDVKLLLSRNNIEFSVDNISLENIELHDNIVHIRNNTVNISGEELLRNFISDSDSICRLSIQWFERYPKYINIMRKNQNDLFNDYNIHKISSDSKRSFINKWIDILKQLKTLEIDQESLNIYTNFIEKQAKKDPTRLRKYHRNISVELHVFNILLMKLLSKIEYYMSYILYFPKIGNMNEIISNKQKNNYKTTNDEMVLDGIKHENNLLKHINKVDLFVNEISTDIIEKINLALSSCSNVIEIIFKYGTDNNTPKEVITLFVQYKKIVRFLLGILYHTNNYKNCKSKLKNIESKLVKNSYLVTQNEYPNKIGFKPHSRYIHSDNNNDNNTNRDVVTIQSKTELKFKFISEKDVEKFCSNKELNFYKRIKSDILSQVNSEFNNIVLAVKRPNSLSGLVLYDQKYNEESQHECILNIKRGINGRPNISIQNNVNDNNLNKSIIKLFKEDILRWFELYYIDRLLLDEKMLSNYSNFNEINVLLQLKLLIACPYLVNNNNIGAIINSFGNSYTLIYLIGKVKDINFNEWNIVTNFNRINSSTEKQIKFLSVIFPNIKNDIKGMCSLQDMNSNIKIPKYIRESNNFTFERMCLSNFESENQDISKSIIKNCLNYVDNGTIIKHIFGDKNIYLKCIDGNFIIQ
ncbi:hypothetical protein RS030_101598 [Cryptosporidium xiaoi]|uniref:Uncharacterized protein n=1 Tax=Cryptosporidium xiaoi TaxID=659607 RepID=A0AAV9Y2U1_9CRYT